MKNKKILSVIMIFCLIMLGLSYYFIAKSKYELVEDFDYFPLPKSKYAVLSKGNELERSYEWPSVSGEYGIPLSYKIIIKTNGWEAVESDGNYTIYKKDNTEIRLTISTSELNIFKHN